MKTKRMAWEDMLKAMEKIGLPISEKTEFMAALCAQISGLNG